MRNLIIAGILSVAAVVLFFADMRNQAATTRLLENMAAAKPAMQDVAFKVPFVPDAPKAAQRPTRYQAGFHWADHVSLKLYDLGGGYWQTNAFELLAGQEADEKNEWRAHVRFKFNPPTDPLHPGHSIVAVADTDHSIRFAPLGAVDFGKLSAIPAARWRQPVGSELPAVWKLKPGDVVGLKVTTKGKTMIAKLHVRKLSHQDVRFDYVLRSDDKGGFPPPNPLADE